MHNEIAFLDVRFNFDSSVLELQSFDFTKGFLSGYGYTALIDTVAAGASPAMVHVLLIPPGSNPLPLPPALATSVGADRRRGTGGVRRVLGELFGGGRTRIYYNLFGSIEECIRMFIDLIEEFVRI